MLSYKYWEQSHGSDPNIVGKVFRRTIALIR